jgi:ADP-dependent phosphofructokinase/glucokinase
MIDNSNRREDVGERIVLGLGDNTDCEITWDSTVFEQFIADFRIVDSELGSDVPISSLRDLVVSILGFLKSERGGERFIDSQKIIEDFASRFSAKITIGGTSARAAIAMRKLGATSALHLVTINDHVRRLLPPDIPWVCSNDHDSSFPHLIVQFDRDTRVEAGDISIHTSQANRIIYDNDHDNIEMRLDPEFARLVGSATVFLISGFNAMQSAQLLAQRLQMLRVIMQSLPAGALVFYEDACFHKPELSAHVREALIDSIDFYSMNEDEMRDYVGLHVELLDADSVYEALLALHSILPVPVLVVHTRHWTLAYGTDVAQYSHALKGGITMATTRLRFGDNFTRANYEETELLPSEPTAAGFATALNKLAGGRVLCLPSVRIAETKVTTIGLGDAFVGGFLPALAKCIEKKST